MHSGSLQKVLQFSPREITKFIVRNNTLITPNTTSDVLEGINRKTVLELAKDMGIPVVERDIDLTELYIADEAFACGTSAYLAPIFEIDSRRIGNKTIGPLTVRLRKQYTDVLHGHDESYKHLVTVLN
ncbi:hypothetical protein B7Z00_03210 [Candidatus Saccharibacteria bacterium 32-50-10]|nr:MAG: hypothetical protein B7Z00_03210 [Candidatus Saccharibacteria bacterium 32-50-10]